MAIIETIDQDLRNAMRNRETKSVTTLRSVKASLQNATIENRGDLKDEQIINVLQREIKKRKEAAELYKRSKREDHVEQELEEIKIIEKYLPEQMSNEELAQLIEQAAQETGANSPSDIGRVISLVVSRAGGKADGGRIANAVRAKLQK
ncbi:MAG TPA: GatB/YqeY domain-containing protein [bacterium]|jgi:uncharacterized protein YqeY|nr:GatB/YqeY domain-containing protein [bacterium]